MSNRLAGETSPYLLAHANNPVDWYPWGSEALARSSGEDKPIFLSIGYSACHWCHVMEHESFENAQIAAILNAEFVCIKVDREERPDLDQVYMNAVQLMTGRGGWPMSVFLTPQLKPFYGGTYWPPQAQRGMPGFDQVLASVADAWKHRRDQVREQAESLVDHLAQAVAVAPADTDPPPALLSHAVVQLERSYDREHGGFGAAPKFPHPMDLRLLAHAWHRQRDDGLLAIVTHTLDRMAAGGMYDQLRGGFHRYSVDAEWLVPHFEKMLYDNALLVPAYVDAWRITRDPEYARVAREICDYVLAEMTDPAGGFYSTQDADSEGEEGKFFVWTPDELEAVLGTGPAKTFGYAYGVTPEGNFEHGTSILHRPQTIAHCAQRLGIEADELAAELRDSRAKLLAARAGRVRPALDDKVILAWNGLMIDALADAAGALDEPRYLAAAQRGAEFALTELRGSDGRWRHCWRGGRAKLDAYLDDHAALAGALVTLYEADFNERWIDEAAGLADLILEHFEDGSQGGFYFTAHDHEPLITRQKDFYDNAVPSGNSLAALALLRLGKLTGSDRYLAAARRTLRAATAVMQQAPRASAQMLLALDMALGPTPEIVILGNAAEQETSAALADLRRRFVPNKVVACRGPSPTAPRSVLVDPLFAGKQSAGPEPAVFICEHFTCQAPIFGQAAASAAWDALASEPRQGR